MYLEPIGEGHLDATKDWANDPELQSLMLRSSYVTEKDQRNWLAELRQNSGKLVFAVHSTHNGLHIGNIGLYNISREHKRAEFWILIGDTSARRNGFAEESMDLLLRYGFTELCLNRVYLVVQTENRPAINLYEKVGFVTEGLLKEYACVHGKSVDVFMMALLKKDYTRYI